VYNIKQQAIFVLKHDGRTLWGCLMVQVKYALILWAQKTMLLQPEVSMREK